MEDQEEEGVVLSLMDVKEAMAGYLEEVYLPDNIHEYSVDFVPMSNSIKLNFLYRCECTQKLESKPYRTLANSATSVIWQQQLVCLLGALI